ncbi:MAG: hypothetical protein A2W90_14465 [Bacteroidetes bacterium GWF2_42_66]|nr:MAG: hypothetical protein A2W92_15860 [Bacteroidetes bacterium GWA2_42_15]OFX99101.1 MAG: hypothetical protein A2W89_06795 [Bacteroidetes bacterium GWE2_42_39]OFY46730.1 MAG: hypothetical protein A2W90_14465 [Bacteroidetes bacterium GWF2_42_66]HAZ00677.1 hypothetical protein [Marinilabiliales bacterium]HBL73864.1 hypothetical protein [Prolixibacteraceae bacterium]
MKNLIECLQMVQCYEMKIDWGWINDNGEGCQMAVKDGYIELVKQPYDDWCGSVPIYAKLTPKGKKVLDKVSDIHRKNLKNMLSKNSDGDSKSQVNRSL